MYLMVLPSLSSLNFVMQSGEMETLFDQKGSGQIIRVRMLVREESPRWRWEDDMGESTLIYSTVRSAIAV